MLQKLIIENIALISNLELELKDGLNILSGETGAGKSIIIDSFNFVLGERADKSLIRYGTDYSTVQAIFDNYNNANVDAYLNEIDIEPEDILILKRKMTVEGKNECRINGKVVTLSMLKGLTELLVDIHGQHEHQSLLNNKTHLTLLDNLSDENLLKTKEEYQNLYKCYHNALNELSKYGNEEERLRKMDILQYQLAEIEKVAIGENEQEELLALRKKIRNMEKILDSLEVAKSELYGEDGDGIASRIKNAYHSLSSISDYDESVPELQNRLDACKVEIQDITETISDMLRSFDFDAKRADEVEERLDEIKKMFNKFGGSYQSLMNFYDKAKGEYEVLANAKETVEKLEIEIDKISRDILKKSKELTKAREEVASKFEKQIIKELKDLGMGSSTFKVSIESTEDIDEFNSNGADTVEFLISPNAGEPLKPLSKIISGGEMSRFMLAFKNILAGKDEIQTMVFDEIDTGISGNISAVVSEKMANISVNRQVIAVTHMPSLAAMADNHYLIAKEEKDGKTYTYVTLLEDDLDEIARLIGGNNYSQYAIPHAKEMKKWASDYKKSIK